MYKFSYAEIIDDGGTAAREREQLALDKALEMLSIAEARGSRSPEAISALQHVQRLWNFLIEDLGRAENALTDQLRADLISIGLWVIREADRILNDPTKTFGALIDVNRTIRDGLR